MRSILLALLTVAAVASTAAAQSRHDRLSIKPLKQGSQTVGITLKLTLLPNTFRDGDIVRIGLGRNNWQDFTKAKGATDHRSAAADKAYGYAVYQKEIRDIKTDDPREVTLEIPYADMPDLKPGDSVDVFTAWGREGKVTNTWHVWGVNGSFNGTNNKLVLKTPPGKAVAYAKAPVESMVVIAKTGPAVTVDLAKAGKTPAAKAKPSLSTPKTKIAAAAKPTPSQKPTAARKSAAKTKSKSGK